MQEKKNEDYVEMYRRADDAWFGGIIKAWPRPWGYEAPEAKPFLDEMEYAWWHMSSEQMAQVDASKSSAWSDVVNEYHSLAVRMIHPKLDGELFTDLYIARANLVRMKEIWEEHPNERGSFTGPRSGFWPWQPALDKVEEAIAANAGVLHPEQGDH